jgi:hypothetical protein
MFLRKIIFTVLVGISFTNSLFGQHPIGDKLEQLYSQGHYGIVYRKAKKYNHIPNMETLIFPKYYIAVSGLQRVNNVYWYGRNMDIPSKSISELNRLKLDKNGYQYLVAHAYELYELKNDLNNWLTTISQSKHKQKVSEYAELFKSFFNDFDFTNFEFNNNSDQIDLRGVSTARQELVKFSKNYLGVPYKWGGTSSDGFDCSGFTQFVLKNKGINIPRTAVDQYAKCTRKDKSNVQCGDLIFFHNDNKISHVGMVISKMGEPIKMIHSSSSQGISIIEIDKSDYWKKRFYAFGSFLE